MLAGLAAGRDNRLLHETFNSVHQPSFCSKLQSLWHLQVAVPASWADKGVPRAHATITAPLLRFGGFSHTEQNAGGLSSTLQKIRDAESMVLSCIRHSRVAGLLVWMLQVSYEGHNSSFAARQALDGRGQFHVT